MKVKELMERVPTTNPGYAIAYINDGLREIQAMIPDNIIYAVTDMTKNQRFYAMPSDLVSLRSVLIYDETDEKYIKIPRTVFVGTDDKDNA